MDYRSQQPMAPKHIAPESSLPIAAFAVSIVGIFFAFVPFFGTICPAIAVTLALLSRGGSMHTSGKNKAALILGIIGILLAIVTTVSATYYFVTTFDPQTFWEEFNELYNQTSGNYL